MYRLHIKTGESVLFKKNRRVWVLERRTGLPIEEGWTSRGEVVGGMAETSAG
jgi:hypothetical protein